MNTALWVIQALLAAIFVFSGAMKATFPREALVAKGQTGIQHYPQSFIRFVAWCELLGSAGVIVPWLTGIGRFLTPLAATGLGIIMVGAALSHARLVREDPTRRQRESANVRNNVILLSACAFVAIGRGLMLGAS